jgi:hypothetical protein
MAAPLATAVATTILGIDVAAIGWAFVGGVLSLIWVPKFKHWWNVLISIGSSTVIGSAFATWSAKPALLTIEHFAPWLKEWAQTAQPIAICALALIIGLSAQFAMPGLLSRIGLVSRGKQA